MSRRHTSASRSVAYAGAVALALTTAACGASPRVERAVTARHAAAARAALSGESAAVAGGAVDDSGGVAAPTEAQAGSGAAGGGYATTPVSGPAVRATPSGAGRGTTTPPDRRRPSGGGGPRSRRGRAGQGAAPAAPAGGNGGATDVGVTATSIKIGGTFFNGGYLDKYSQVTEQAASAYFKYVNDQGGVYGRKIEFVPCDTAGTADGTQGCLRKLANDDKVFAMGPSLDFNLDTVPTFLADKKLPWVGIVGPLPRGAFAARWMFPSQIPGADVGDPHRHVRRQDPRRQHRRACPT